MSVQSAAKGLIEIFGEECIRRLDDNKAIQSIPRITSGSPKLDRILGGGWPMGRMVEIYGPFSGGKTTLALEAIAAMQRLCECDPRLFTSRGMNAEPVACYIDTEHALDPVYVNKLGIRKNTIWLCQPTDGDEAMKVAHDMAACGDVKILVIDSIAGIVARQTEEGEPRDANIGAEARLLSRNIPKLGTRISLNQVVCIFTNQERKNPGQQYGDPTYCPGGNAIPSYTSIRVRVRSSGKIEEGDVIVSNTVHCKCVKNKTAPPFRETDITIRFGEGIDFVPDYIDEALECGAINQRGSWFYHSAPGKKDLKLGQGRSNVEQALRGSQKKQDQLLDWINEAKDRNTT